MSKKIVKQIVAFGICICVVLGSVLNTSIFVSAAETQTNTKKIEEQAVIDKTEETKVQDQKIEEKEETIAEGNQGEPEKKEEAVKDQPVKEETKTEETAKQEDSTEKTEEKKEEQGQTSTTKSEDSQVMEGEKSNSQEKSEAEQKKETSSSTEEQNVKKTEEEASKEEATQNLLKSARATSNVTLGNSVTGHVSDSNNTNVYRFTVSTPGKVTLNMMSYVETYNIILYDNNGKEIWDDLYNSWNSSLEYISHVYNLYLEKGSYSLVIEAYRGKETYKLKTGFLSSGTNVPEPNNSFNNAHQVNFGITYTGQTSWNDEYDNFKFTLTKSGRVTISLTSYMESCDFYLYDLSGKELDSHTYISWNSSQGYIGQTYTYDLEKGDYYIKIARTLDCCSGKYKIKFDFKSANATNTEPDNTYQTGTKLNMGQYYYGQIALNDSHDIYRFSLSSKTTLRINFTSYMEYCHIRILNNAGSEVWGDTYLGWNESQGYISKSYSQTLDAGDYAIQVEQCYDATGTYKILVNDGKERIQLNKTTASLTNLGQTVQLSATVTPSAKVTWSSSSTSVATVSSSGKVTAKGFGKATITAKTAKGTTAKCTIHVLPARASITKITNPSYSQLKIEWKKVGNVSGYEVYRNTRSTGTFTKVKTVTSPTTLSFTNAGLESGTKYYYKVRAYKNVGTKKVYGTFSTVVSATPIPSRVTGVTTRSARYDAVELSWNKVNGATAYEIYRSASATSGFTKIRTLIGSSNTTLTNTGLVSGKTYYYKIRAYRSVYGKKVYGTFSNVVSRKPIPGKPAIKSVQSTTSKKATVTWSQISGASGYEVYRCNTKSGTYKRIATVSGGSRLTYTNSGLTSQKAYYYKVRAYRTVNGQKVFGLLSEAKSGKVK